MKRVSNHLLSADLFAGAGGLTVGLHAAGFRSVFFNEIDDAASATFQHNFPEARAYTCPIEELTAERIFRDTQLEPGQLDLLVGGPPCQGFSINAPIRSERDDRNHLFRHYVRLVCEGLRPKCLVLENVPGLISMGSGKTLQDVLAAFGEAGYRAEARILNAAHYGVPEERWRLIILATRLNGAVLRFPNPTHYSKQRANFSGGRTHTFTYAVRPEAHRDMFGGSGLARPVTVGEAIDDLPAITSGGGKDELQYEHEARNAYQRGMRGGAKVLFNHHCAGLSAINLERLSHVPPGGSWRDIPEQLLPEGMKRARRSDHTKRYGRLNPEAPSGTIMTKCDPHWGTVVHYDQDRILSVRECARIQSFPDAFRFLGNKQQQYRQVGNAVPPLLATAIAEAIKDVLSKSQKEVRCRALAATT